MPSSYFIFLGSVNEAGVFALRGRQEGSRRARRTTTTTSTSTTITTTTYSTSGKGGGGATPLTYISSPLIPAIAIPEDVVEPAALLAPDEESWPTNGPPRSGTPSSSRSHSPLTAPSRAGIEIVAKPQRKVVLPCELDANYSKILLPASR